MAAALKSLAFLLLLILLWAVGLWAFTTRVIASTPAPDQPQADGIVALTGTSSLRLTAATQLLEDGAAKRLLISGVNPESTRADVREAAKDMGRAWECCVDLGFRAENTQGNARETAAWAKFHHYKSLIVVTSDYHMPRAVLELRAMMPGVILYPYPVATTALHAHGWWRTEGRRMVLEYCKYLVILAREGVLGIGRGHRAAPAPRPAKVLKVETR